MTTYEGFDVLEVEPNWRDGIDSTYRRDWIRFDPGTGKVRVDDKTGCAALDGSFSWFLEDRAAIASFKSFVNARKGQAVPFWLPTWRSDIQLADDVVSNSATITISLIGYTKFMFAQAARRRIAFILADGSKVYRKVIAASDPGNGTTETLTLDAAPGVALPASTTLVSLLTLCRLEADEVKVQWHTQTVAEASLAFREIPKEVPA